MSAMITTITEVFTAIVGEVIDVLTLYTTNTLLLFLLGLMFAGAIFSFAQRLIHRT